VCLFRAATHTPRAKPPWRRTLRCNNLSRILSSRFSGRPVSTMAFVLSSCRCSRSLVRSFSTSVRASEVNFDHVQHLRSRITYEAGLKAISVFGNQADQESASDDTTTATAGQSQASSTTLTPASGETLVTGTPSAPSSFTVRYGVENARELAAKPPPREDPLLSFFTNLIMKDGKKGVSFPPFQHSKRFLIVHDD
jgi:hypothetical protein